MQHSTSLSDVASQVKFRVICLVPLTFGCEQTRTLGFSSRRFRTYRLLILLVHVGLVCSVGVCGCRALGSLCSFCLRWTFPDSPCTLPGLRFARFGVLRLHRFVTAFWALLLTFFFAFV